MRSFYFVVACLMSCGPVWAAQKILPLTHNPSDQGRPAPLPPGDDGGARPIAPTHEEIPPPLTGEVPLMPPKKEYPKEED